MRAVKKVERNMDRCQNLLVQMTCDPEKVLEALGPSEVDEVIGTIDQLTQRASTPRKGSDLLALSEDVLRLVDDVPTLKTRFPITRYRSGTQAEILSTHPRHAVNPI